MYQYDCDRPIDEHFLCYIAYHGDSYESVKLYLDIVNLIFKEDIERDYRGKLKNYDSTLFQFYMIWDYIARWRKDNSSQYSEGLQILIASLYLFTPLSISESL